MDLDKLARLQALNKTKDNRGAPRRKTTKKTAASSNEDEQKVAVQVKKLGAQQITGVEEVNMFKGDGKVIHFRTPKGIARATAQILMNR